MDKKFWLARIDSVKPKRAPMSKFMTWANRPSSIIASMQTAKVSMTIDKVAA
jgi:hypothetical protein